MLRHYYCFYRKYYLIKQFITVVFSNLSPMFTIFGIPVNNDIVVRSHDFGCHGTHFGMKICVTIVTKMGILLH